MQLLTQLRRVQTQLEALYALEPAPDVAEFVQLVAADERETLLVRHDEAEGAVSLRLLLPERDALPAGLCDHYLQAVEGVSHFVLVAQRARQQLPTTLLELELQGEVDKFALLVLDTSLGDPDARAAASQLSANDNDGAASSPLTLHEVHDWLFERASYLHPEDSSEGSRYRAANRLAARFWSRLLAADASTTQQALRRFYRASPDEKIRLAKAV